MGKNQNLIKHINYENFCGTYVDDKWRIHNLKDWSRPESSIITKIKESTSWSSFILNYCHFKDKPETCWFDREYSSGRTNTLLGIHQKKGVAFKHTIDYYKKNIPEEYEEISGHLEK